MHKSSAEMKKEVHKGDSVTFPVIEMISVWPGRFYFIRILHVFIPVLRSGSRPHRLRRSYTRSDSPRCRIGAG